MSTSRMIEVGAAAAQAAIDAGTRSGGDAHAAALRVGILEFLRVHAQQMPGDTAAGHANLLEAYREWLDAAFALYSTGEESKLGDYVRRGAALAAELELAAAAPPPPVPEPAATAAETQ